MYFIETTLMSDKHTNNHKDSLTFPFLPQFQDLFFYIPNPFFVLN